MKLSNLFFILFVIILFFVASCTQNKTETMESMQMENDAEDLEFKQMCQESGYEWMLMKPTQDGKITLNEESCWGCMVEDIEHICYKEKFMELMK